MGKGIFAAKPDMREHLDHHERHAATNGFARVQNLVGRLRCRPGYAFQEQVNIGINGGSLVIGRGARRQSGKGLFSMNSHRATFRRGLSFRLIVCVPEQDIPHRKPSRRFHREDDLARGVSVITAGMPVASCRASSEARASA